MKANGQENEELESIITQMMENTILEIEDPSNHLKILKELNKNDGIHLNSSKAEFDTLKVKDFS